VFFLVILYFIGAISISFLIGLTILFNFAVWLVGPKIQDWIYRRLYKLKWISIDDLRKRSPKAADFVERTCNKYRFPAPRLGVIPDKNPNAFTYGSGRWNSRLIVTEGIFEYLDGEEVKSVYAHELGHVKNRDFVVMAIAVTLLQILFEIYIVSRSASRSGGRKKGTKFPRRSRYQGTRRVHRE